MAWRRDKAQLKEDAGPRAVESWYDCGIVRSKECTCSRGPVGLRMPGSKGASLWIPEEGIVGGCWMLLRAGAALPGIPLPSFLLALPVAVLDLI